MIKIKKYKQIYSEIIGKLLKTFLNSPPKKLSIKYIYSNRSEPKSLNLSKPKKLSSMFDLAEKLSSTFDYVRVDLYH
tara:strand:+ start:5385 stop:5615 length:231 start_codon:yes stop_codon:yes gene_type:complete